MNESKELDTKITPIQITLFLHKNPLQIVLIVKDTKFSDIR